MLTRLAIKNFKSIGDPGLDLELKPLTLLVGPNGAGKSSVLEALALLAQSVDHEGLHLQSGPVAYGSLLDVVYRRDPEKWAAVEIAGADRRSAGYRCSINAKQYVEQTIIPPSGLTFRQPEARVYPMTVGYYPGVPGLYKYKEPPVLAETSRVGDQAGRILSSKAFDLFQYDGTRPEEKALIEQYVKYAQVEITRVASLVRDRVFLLRGARGVETGPVKDQSWPGWVGPTGKYLIHALSHIFGPAGDASTVGDVRRWSTRFGLDNMIGGWLGDEGLGARYTDGLIRAELPLASSSYGERQVLNVITHLALADSLSINMIEEPEISLHPEAQVDMARLLATAAAEGKQVLATTHSTFLLMALRKVVAEGILTGDQIAIYEITKTKQGSIATHLPLHHDGYIEGWVPSFSSIERDLLSGWLDIIPEAK